MQIIDVIDKLAKHPHKRYKRRDLAAIKRIVVHHSATETGSPEAFARYHVESNNWPGIGYHYVIAKDGTVYKTQPATVISYHAAGANSTSLGVCLVGNFDRETLGAAQKAALLELLRELIAAYHVPAVGVIGHREVPGARKSCPGKHVDMEKIRAELA